MRQFATCIVCSAVLFGTATCGWSQTSIPGSSLVYKSLGTSSTTLSQSGYLGTYLTVPAGGATVNFDVNATGLGAAAHMNLVIADSQFGFNINSSSATDYNTQNVTLPAGTYFVRAERDFDGGVNQSFSVNNLSVNTVDGGAATFSNSASATNAMSAANSYINNYRKSSLNLSVSGVAPGTPIEIKEVNSAFKWGTAVPDSLRTNLVKGATDTTYERLLKQDFNSMTPENGGKWSESDTATQLKDVDRMMSFAADNNMRVRMHNLIWGSQQPSRVNTDFTNARSTIPTTAAAGKAAIQSEITNRIATYVGGTNSETGGTTGKPAVTRANQFQELDVYNESYHTGSATSVSSGDNYWKVLGDGTVAGGAAPIAGIYNQVQSAVTAAGSSAKLFTNEYNVLNNNSDQYGQFYSQHAESIRSAGGAVTGLGTEWYNSPGVGQNGSQVDPSRAYATWQNLSSQGLPLEVTEYGVTSVAGADQATELTTAMTLAFGTQQMTGFTIWGFYNNGSVYSGSAGSVLYDTNFNITAAGTAYEALRQAWTTDSNTTVGADGSVNLPGAFYGDYQAIISGKSYNFTFDPATNNFVVSVPLMGDYNGDGIVNAADYAVWRASFGQTGTGLAADGNNNGMVDQADYNIWANNFGNPSGGAGAAAATTVPEPSSFLLLAMAAVGACVIGRMRH